MATFLRLSQCVLNVDEIQSVHFSVDPPIASVVLIPGYDEHLMRGDDALFLMDFFTDRVIPGLQIMAAPDIAISQLTDDDFSEEIDD